MRIVLEGPDNAGKTTLANRIIDEVGDFEMYKHPGGRPVDLSAEVLCIDEQMDWLKRRRVIIDRVTPISQRVYNPSDQLDEMRAQAWWDMRTIYRPVVIYCRPSTDKLLRTEDLTWRDGESDEHKQKIIENQHTFVARYDAIFQSIPCIQYNYEDTEMSLAIVTKCVAGMRGERLAEGWLRDHMNRWSIT